MAYYSTTCLLALSPSDVTVHCSPAEIGSQHSLGPTFHAMMWLLQPRMWKFPADRRERTHRCCVSSAHTPWDRPQMHDPNSLWKVWDMGLNCVPKKKRRNKNIGCCQGSQPYCPAPWHRNLRTPSIPCVDWLFGLKKVSHLLLFATFTFIAFHWYFWLSWSFFPTLLLPAPA